jgi:hypothetical protein
VAAAMTKMMKMTQTMLKTTAMVNISYIT